MRRTLNYFVQADEAQRLHEEQLEKLREAGYEVIGDCVLIAEAPKEVKP